MNQSVQKHPIEIIMLLYSYYKNKFEINNKNVLDTLNRPEGFFNQHNGSVSFEKKILYKMQSVGRGGGGQRLWKQKYSGQKLKQFEIMRFCSIKIEKQQGCT